METIGFLGLGRMGGPMAARIRAAGWQVIAFDPSAEARQRGSASGLQITDGQEAVFSGVDVVITMLPDDRSIESFLHHPSHSLDLIKPDTLWVEMTSSRPVVTRQLSGAVADRGSVLLDAPVSGGVTGAEKGKLTIFAGGDREVLDRARHLLEAVASSIYHVGHEPGHGDLAKSLNNMLSAINLTAASEALALAAHDGLDLPTFVDAVTKSSGSSQAMTVKIGRFALAKDFTAGFTINQYLKDLRIARSAFDTAHMPTRLASLTADLWRHFADEGHGEEDHTRIVPLMIELDGAMNATAAATQSAY